MKNLKEIKNDDCPELVIAQWILTVLIIATIIIFAVSQKAGAEEPYRYMTATYYGATPETYRALGYNNPNLPIDGFRYGDVCASGQVFDPLAMGCAVVNIGRGVPEYPFGTILYVENVQNGKSVLVKVTDTGAEKGTIDLYIGAAAKIFYLGQGKCVIKIRMATKKERRRYYE